MFNITVYEAGLWGVVFDRFIRLIALKLVFGPKLYFKTLSLKVLAKFKEKCECNDQIKLILGIPIRQNFTETE